MLENIYYGYASFSLGKSPKKLNKLNIQMFYNICNGMAIPEDWNSDY